MSGSRRYGRMLAPVEEKRSGCEETRKETFLMVEATPRRRVCEAWEVKTVSFVRGTTLS